MSYAQTNGIKTYYEILGSGEPLALVGGSMFGRENWAMAWDTFSEHFSVITYDQRGYGLSDRPLERYTLDLWADDLLALLDALEIDRAHVAGTSAGAMIAIKFAAKYPERCVGMVSDCGMAKPDRMRKMIFKTWREMAQTMGCGDAFADHLVTQALGPHILDSPQAEQVIETVRDVVRMMSVETVVQACLSMEEMDLREDVKQITAPSLVIGSVLDYLTPMETAESGAGIQYLIDNLSDCESRIYTDIGHADLLEKKDESLPLIVDFLKRASQKVNR